MTRFWAEAHQPAEKMNEADADEIWEWLQSKPAVPLTARKLNGH